MYLCHLCRTEPEVDCVYMVMEEGRSPSIMAKAKWSPKLAFLLADLAVDGARPGETERETKEKRTRR